MSIETHQAYFLFEQVGVELEKGGSTKADGQNQNHNSPYSLFHNFKRPCWRSYQLCLLLS